MSFLYPFASSARSSSRHSTTSSHRHGSSKRRPSSVYLSSHTRHSAPALFNLGPKSNYSMGSSIFSFGGSSSRRAKPRSGFISRMVRKIRRLFRDIMHYMKRHPMKTLMMVVMPLLTSGVLAKLLSVVGVRLPHSLSRGGSDFGSSGGSGFGDMSGLFSLAKMFI
ncbi:hypothetical protein FQN57_007136 [Myotisia sp. PD_48]|nr:hypothetical protein FQN57_007136 [Myotisia sp. PD_48]